MSPSWNSIGGSPASMDSTQHVPRKLMWNGITCAAPGISLSPISAIFGVSHAIGSQARRSKNIAPVRRTARKTSDKTSIGTFSRRKTRCKQIETDCRNSHFSKTIGNNVRTGQHGPI